MPAELIDVRGPPPHVNANSGRGPNTVTSRGSFGRGPQKFCIANKGRCQQLFVFDTFMNKLPPVPALILIAAWPE